MSHRRDSGSDVVHVRTTNDPPPETWFPNSGDNSVWATEDDYNRVCAMNTDDAESSSKKIRSSSSEIGKSFFKTKLCFKFRAGTCPYAASSCHFAHSSEELRRPPPPNRQETATEASRNREIFAIPRGYGAASDGGNVAQTLKSPNWKTRICNKWEITGYCPFGTNCHFAHGASELHRFGGGLVEGEGKIGTYTTPDTKQTGLVDTVTSLVSPGVPSQRTSNAVTQKPRKWKGPDKISRVYGDWIDDIE